MRYSFFQTQAAPGREREVMALVVSGLLHKQVDGELGISEITACVAWGAIWDYGAVWQKRWAARSRAISVPFFQLP
jgi:FixJ family two-component response regulator